MKQFGNPGLSFKYFGCHFGFAGSNLGVEPAALEERGFLRVREPSGTRAQ